MSSFACFGCKPDVIGTKASQNKANELIANISREWSGRSEASIGFCSEMSLEERFQMICPTNDRLTACLEVTNGELSLINFPKFI